MNNQGEIIFRRAASTPGNGGLVADTYTNLLIHLVFSCKDREPWLKPAIRERLFPYMGGIVRDNGGVLLCVGGTADHVHMLVSIPPDLSVSRMAQLIKGASSRWTHETFPEMRGFAWQKGYGAFSLGVSQIAATRAYIEGQLEHHRAVSFQAEYLAFLRKNAIPYDERYVWG